MEEKQNYTDVDILNDAVSSLGRLRIPVEMTEEFGSEVARVWKNLNALLKAHLDHEMREQGWTPREEQNDTEEPVLELVPMEEPEETE